MINAEQAISQTRRSIAQSTLLRWTLIFAVALAIVIEPLFNLSSMLAVGVMLAVGGFWMYLSIRSARGSRIAANSSNLIAAGQFELAEQNIGQAIDSFSLFRNAKLMSLHHLAVLRHAQNRWQDAAILSGALLRQRLGNATGLDRSSRLILAESLLELGDLSGAYEQISRLYNQRLSLREAINLLAVQVDYMARVGAWNQLFQGIKTKVEMAELMGNQQSARTQALLALSARKLDRSDWFEWLKQRVELITDVQRLCTERPMLREVWK